MVTVAVTLVKGTPSTTSITALPSLIIFGATVRVKEIIWVRIADHIHRCQISKAAEYSCRESH